MNCIHCGQSNLPIEVYSFHCETPSQHTREIELELCLSCLSELRLDPDFKLMSVKELDD